MPASLPPGQAATPAVLADHAESPAPTAEQISALSALVCERRLTSQQLGTVSALLDFVGRSLCADHRATEEFPEVWGPVRTRYLRLIDSLGKTR